MLFFKIIFCESFNSRLKEIKELFDLSVMNELNEIVSFDLLFNTNIEVQSISFAIDYNETIQTEDFNTEVNKIKLKKNISTNSFNSEESLSKLKQIFGENWLNETNLTKKNIIKYCDILILIKPLSSTFHVFDCHLEKFKQFYNVFEQNLKEKNFEKLSWNVTRKITHSLFTNIFLLYYTKFETIDENIYNFHVKKVKNDLIDFMHDNCIVENSSQNLKTELTSEISKLDNLFKFIFDVQLCACKNVKNNFSKLFFKKFN